MGQIDGYFPFVDLSEFLEMYTDGEYSKKLIEKFHLSGYVEYKKLLQILKMPQKRKSTQKTDQSREMNLKDRNLLERYVFLRKMLSRFLPTIKTKITYNVLKSAMLLQLYSNMYDFINKKTLVDSIHDAVTDFERLVLAPHTPISAYDDGEIRRQANSILDELSENNFLEGDSLGRIRLKKHQLEIHNYILNTIRRREGITYQDLVSAIKAKIPILSQIPPVLFQIALHELISDNKIVKKEGYWKLRPYYDEYFTVKHYRKLYFENSRITKKQRFFGRKITPDEFIDELKYLDRGDFEDQDDQVTRIAGMILANSPMMSHPPNGLDEFDFAVDLSNYEFTAEQQNVMRVLDLKIRSNIVYVKVMIDANLTVKLLSDLVLNLNKRGLNEQGFIIHFSAADGLVQRMLKNDKTIQLILESDLKEWCKITPVIPSRRGAVAVIRKGRHEGVLTKIKSVNYESGMANIVLLPDMRNDVQYIGFLEEITLDVAIDKITDYSSKYFEFLRRLCQITKYDIVRLIVTGGLPVLSRMKESPDVHITSLQISCEFYGYSKTKIHFVDPDRDALRYTTNDLFSCTCFIWEHQSKAQGLCEHVVFILNETVKKILSRKTRLPYIDEELMLSRIEDKMDLFLRRLRYTNSDGSNATCPNCGCIARTIEQVENLFGYRTMDRNNKFSTRRQSRCKKCRR